MAVFRSLSALVVGAPGGRAVRVNGDSSGRRSR